jgi:hypothetical protein
MSLQAERVGADLIKIARDTEITSFLPLAERLKTVPNGTDVIALLLKRYFSELEAERERAAREEEDRIHREGEQEKRARKESETSEASPDDRRGRGRKPEPRRREESHNGAPTERPREREREREPELPPMAGDRVRLFINRGSTDGFDEAKVKSYLAEVAGTDDGLAVARVQLRRTHSFVEVTEVMAVAAVAAAERGLELADKPVTIERARTR